MYLFFRLESLDLFTNPIDLNKFINDNTVYLICKNNPNIKLANIFMYLNNNIKYENISTTLMTIIRL